jgi:hypothetical protein
MTPLETKQEFLLLEQLWSLLGNWTLYVIDFFTKCLVIFQWTSSRVKFCNMTPMGSNSKIAPMGSYCTSEVRYFYCDSRNIYKKIFCVMWPHLGKTIVNKRYLIIFILNDLGRIKFKMADKRGFYVFYLILLKNEPQIGQRPIKGDSMFLI